MDNTNEFASPATIYSDDKNDDDEWRKICQKWCLNKFVFSSLEQNPLNILAEIYAQAERGVRFHASGILNVNDFFPSFTKFIFSHNGLKVEVQLMLLVRNSDPGLPPAVGISPEE